MSQPSVLQFFNVRKRAAPEDAPGKRASKVLKFDDEKIQTIPSKKAAPAQKANDLDQIKAVLKRSDKLAELKKSLERFKQSEKQLKAAEERTNELLASPKLKTFKSIEFDVLISPQKAASPEKPYLSPRKKDVPCRNLLSAFSPTKTLEEAPKAALPLPYKYKTISEIFRAVDTIAQILYNRKELITFDKLKPAAEKLVKRTITEKHLAQLKNIYPDSYDFRLEKVKSFGQERCVLAVAPTISAPVMTTQDLLERRKTLHSLLINKTKSYHLEFLQNLTPPFDVNNDKITRWHPEFDLEKVPDLDAATLPKPATSECLSGQQVLEKARQIFNCNTRMNLALDKLQQTAQKAPDSAPESTLKGIPAAILERVRQKQAAKALMSMTRTDEQERQMQMLARLPDIARVTRSVFVAEKKAVMELDAVVGRLMNSYRSRLTNEELVQHLEEIAKRAPDWLVFHKLRNSVFLKLNKKADLSLVVEKLK